MDTNEFFKKYKTLTAKLNLVFAYKSASTKTFEELGIDRSAYAFNYADFLYLDMQSLVLTLFDNKDPEHWRTLEKRFLIVDKYYTMILEKIDK